MADALIDGFDHRCHVDVIVQFTGPFCGILIDQLTFRDALHVAAAAGRAATVRALLDSGAWEAEATNGIGETPRQMAAERGHAEVVELLAGRGAR